MDDHPAVRAGLLAIVDCEPGIVSLGAVEGAEPAVKQAERARPDLVLTDYQLSDGDGLTLCRRLEALPDAPRVLLYSAFASDELAIAAVVAGADGVVSKAAAAHELFEAMRRSARGGQIPPALSREALARMGRALEAEDTPILAMRVARTPVAQIADTLSLDPEQVERRIDGLLARLKRRLEAASQDSPEYRPKEPDVQAGPPRSRRGLGGVAGRLVAREAANE